MSPQANFLYSNQFLSCQTDTSFIITVSVRAVEFLLYILFMRLNRVFIDYANDFIIVQQQWCKKKIFSAPVICGEIWFHQSPVTFVLTQNILIFFTVLHTSECGKRTTNSIFPISNFPIYFRYSMCHRVCCCFIVEHRPDARKEKNNFFLTRFEFHFLATEFK